MLFQYWPTANGAGPTLKQHWVKSSCLLRELSACRLCLVGTDYTVLCVPTPHIWKGIEVFVYYLDYHSF